MRYQLRGSPWVFLYTVFLLVFVSRASFALPTDLSSLLGKDEQGTKNELATRMEKKLHEAYQNVGYGDYIPGIAYLTTKNIAKKNDPRRRLARDVNTLAVTTAAPPASVFCVAGLCYVYPLCSAVAIAVPPIGGTWTLTYLGVAGAGFLGHYLRESFAGRGGPHTNCNAVIRLNVLFDVMDEHIQETIRDLTVSKSNGDKNVTEENVRSFLHALQVFLDDELRNGPHLSVMADGSDPQEFEKRRKRVIDAIDHLENELKDYFVNRSPAPEQKAMKLRTFKATESLDPGAYTKG